MTTRLLRLLPLCTKNDKKNFHSSSKLLAFYEINRKGGYPSKSDFVMEPKTVFQRIREGFWQLTEEMKKLKEEMKEVFRLDPRIILRPGEVDVKFKFDGNPKVLEQWVVSCDSDHGEGKSRAKLELTPNGTGLFSGIIDTVPIRDGRRISTGYCNIKTVRPLKSFYRNDVHEWEAYTHLILRIRGDGRNYMLNLHDNATFDLMWNDLHHFVMYTRGGPYWQYVKIPFSKFFLSNRGRTQDTQYRVRLHGITAVGITASDGIPGPFQLEIDFIGVERDESFEETFAYELYNSPHPHYI